MGQSPANVLDLVQQAKPKMTIHTGFRKRMASIPDG
jgi:hypothetical protein